jgi:formamidopyrimidine-DNA glycosylase
MPELPEVETIRRGLSQRIVGKKIVDIDILFPKSFFGSAIEAVGCEIFSIERRAKIIAFGLSNNKYLLFHLKMTGQLIYRQELKAADDRFAGGHPDHNWHAKLPNSTTAMIFYFNDGSKLFFNDMRKFGWCKLLPKEEIDRIFTESYGPEPFSEGFTAEYLFRKAGRMPNKNIKQFLMDQAIVAGIGNIYADEILFDSMISPLRKVKDIVRDEWEKIIKSTIMILEKAIKYGGTTDSDYVDADGKKGGMQNYLNVYHRTGELCPRGCNDVIKRITVGGRGTHYCPVCQR